MIDLLRGFSISEDGDLKLSLKMQANPFIVKSLFWCVFRSFSGKSGYTICF